MVWVLMVVTETCPSRRERFGFLSSFELGINSEFDLFIQGYRTPNYPEVRHRLGVTTLTRRNLSIE